MRLGGGLLIERVFPLFPALPEQLCQFIADITDLLPVRSDIPYLLILRPAMRKPSGEFPLTGIIRRLPIIKERHLHIRIAVSRRNLYGKELSYLYRAAFSLSSNDTDHRVMHQIRQNRYLVECFEVFADNLRFLCQRIRNQSKLFLRDMNGCLEWNITGPDPAIQEIFMSIVPVPQLRSFIAEGGAFLRIRIHCLHRLRVGLIFPTDNFGLFHQVFPIGVKPVRLFFLLRFFLKPQILNGPEYADKCRGHRHHKSGIHKKPHTGAACSRCVDHQQTPQKHRNRHCKGWSDRQKNRLLLRFWRCGRRFNLHRLSIDLLDIPRRTVEQDLRMASRCIISLDRVRLPLSPTPSEMSLLYGMLINTNSAHRFIYGNVLSQKYNMEADDIDIIPEMELLLFCKQPGIQIKPIGSETADDPGGTSANQHRMSS